MATAKKAAKAKPTISTNTKPLSPKLAIEKEIKDAVSTALEKWKKEMGEKKFDKRIKKLVKLFAEDFKAPKKKDTKKAVPKAKK